MSISNRLLVELKPFIEQFPLVAKVYENLRDQLDAMDEPVVTSCGFVLVGNTRMATGEFERAKTKLDRNVLNDVDVMVNVGANIGYYFCHALSLSKEVIAFEPVPRNLRHLCVGEALKDEIGAEGLGQNASRCTYV